MSISVVIPARNEEGNLKACVQAVVAVVADLFRTYEVIIVDDGSTDGTPALADTLASESPNIQVVHHARGGGFARAYRAGASRAHGEWVAVIPGDNEIQAVSLREIFEAVGTSDIVVPVTVNQESRPWVRRTLSRLFTGTVNALFGHRLRYYQGPAIYRADVLHTLPSGSSGFVFLTEMLVRALACGHRAVEVPMYVQPRQFGTSRAVSLYNVAAALRTLAHLVWDIKIRRRPLG